MDGSLIFAAARVVTNQLRWSSKFRDDRVVQLHNDLIQEIALNHGKQVQTRCCVQHRQANLSAVLGVAPEKIAGWVPDICCCESCDKSVAVEQQIPG